MKMFDIGYLMNVFQGVGLIISIVIGSAIGLVLLYIVCASVVELVRRIFNE